MNLRNARTGGKNRSATHRDGPVAWPIAGHGVQGARRSRRARTWVAAFSVVSLLLLGASPALAVGEDPAPASVETVAPAAGGGEVVSESSEETPPPAPVVEEPPIPPAETPAPVPPASEEQPAPSEPESGAQGSADDAGAGAADGVALAADDTAETMTAEEAPEPPYLRWVVTRSDGAAVTEEGTAVAVQGSRDVADAANDELWAGAPVATVSDNTGQDGYVGVDLDRRVGYFMLKQLADDADPTSVHDVVAGENYRARPAAAEGFATGDRVSWVLLDGQASANAPATELVLAADEAGDGSSLIDEAAQGSGDGTIADEDPTAATSVGVFAIPPGGSGTGSYNSNGDATNPLSWTGGHTQVNPQQSQLLSFSSQVVGVGEDAVLEAAWIRPSTTGTFGWSIEYTNAPERWGGSPLIPKPDRSQGGQVIFVDSSSATAAVCVYGGAVPYPTGWGSLGCTTLNYAQTVTFTNLPDGTQQVSISVPLSEGAFGSDGCPPLIGETGYVRSWTGTARNLRNWVAPVEQDNSGVSTCPGLTLTKQLDQQFDLGAGKKIPSDWVVTATPQPAIPGQSPVSGSGTVSSSTLKPGSYVLSESANPAGYALKANWVCESAEGNAGTAWVLDPATSTLTIHEKNRVSCTIVNTDKPGAAKWDKVDDQTPANNIGGSVWSLVGPTGANSSTVSITDNTGQAGYSGLDLNPAVGKFELGNLKWGDYTLTETGAPTGHALVTPTPTINFTISASALTYTLVTPIVNPRIPGEAMWSKVDDQTPSNKIGGSVWTVSAPGLPLDGTEVMDCVAANAVDCIGPDKNPAAGEFLLQSLGWGGYTLTETEAPEGYGLGAPPPSFTFAINATHLSYAHAEPIVNPRVPGEVSWQKIDADNGAHLAGSEWSLVGPAGAASVTVTDNTGQVDYSGVDVNPAAGEFEIVGLAWGSYTVTETKAPAGYSLSDPAPSFVFTIDAEHLAFVLGDPIENQKMQVPGVPITGGVGSDMFTIAGGILLLGALGILSMVRRRRAAISPISTA